MVARSTDYCGYTCPKVDEAIDEAHEDIKDLVPEKLHGDLDRAIDVMTDLIKRHGTELLRSALEQCCTDLNEARSDLANAETRIQQLEHQLDNMVVAYE